MKKILSELLKTKKQKEKERKQYLRFRQANGKRIFKTIQNNPDWT